MASDWKDLGSIAPGGTVFAFVRDGRGRVWLGTGAGLFVRESDRWQPLQHGQPLPALTALAASGATVFVGGARGELLYTRDGGRQWYQGRQDQASTMITSIAPSPDFERDGVALAGTAGAGILRTADGGRTWALCNFGLQDFAVTTLATAPTWGRREIAFAVTEHGLYRSPNGGRAWKRSDSGLEDITVQSLAFSPRFTTDATIFAGTEAHGLYRSVDGGRMWTPWEQGLERAETFAAINTLWLAPDSTLLLLGMADGRIFRSADGGATWNAAASHAPILALGNDGGTLYAGQLSEGLLSSNNGGVTWGMESLQAHSFTRMYANAGNDLYAFGMQEALYHLPGSESQGDHAWAICAPPDASAVITLAVSKPALFVGTTTGLWRRTRNDWELLLADETVTAISLDADFADSGVIWVGGQSGRLYRSGNEGRTWDALAAPQPGLPILAVGTHKGLALAATPGGQGRVIIWLWHAASGKWKPWHQATGVPRVEFRLTAALIWATVGDTLWVAGPAGWQVRHVAPSVILRYLATTDQAHYLLTNDALLVSNDGARFAPVQLPIEGPLLQDIALGHDGLWLLTTGGYLWYHRLE